MIRYLKRLTIRNLVSPYGLATFSYFGFLFAWLFPPDLYTENIHEPDLMFLDMQALLFFTVCVAGFLLGVRFSRFFGAPLSADVEQLVSVRNPLVYLLTPLGAAALCCLVRLILLGGHINFVALLAAQHGDAIKTAGQVGQLDDGWWGRAIHGLTGVLWWCLFRATQLHLKGSAKRLFYLVFCLSLGLGIITCVATVDRGTLMPMLLGLLIIYFFRKTRVRNARVLRLALSGVAAAAALMGTFVVFSFLRGALVLRLLVASLLGYTIVSYNRMSALLAGTMHYAYEGRGVYLSRYLLEESKISSILHLSARFGWPDTFGLWQTEFSSTMAAGLNSSFIWSGAFGYLYSDIGWWAPFYLCLVGLVTGCLWWQFSASKTSGLVLYPWMSTCILFWFGMNSAFSANIVRLAQFAVVLYIYDRLFLRRVGATNNFHTEAPIPTTLSGPVPPAFPGGLF